MKLSKLPQAERIIKGLRILGHYGTVTVNAEHDEIFLCVNNPADCTFPMRISIIDAKRMRLLRFHKDKDYPTWNLFV